MPFIVTIAGRPNVGKSTLFNRLVGRRIALVDPTPGLTRDRREAETEIYGIPILLTDTAGLEVAEPGSVGDRMRRASESAIAEADLVLFVIDARAGVLPEDHTFAELVRSSGRPVLLVVNKCEGRSGEGGFYEAYSLGLDEPVAISAEHGEGIGDLSEAIAARLAPEAEDDAETEDADEAEDAVDEESPDPNRPLRIAIVGRPNAGKSTLVNTILGHDRMLTGPEAGITRDTISVDLERAGRKIKLFDTAGLRRRSRITERAEELAASDAVRAIRFAEVVVLLIDAERALEHQDLQIADLVISEGRALVIAVNKWDLVADKQKLLKDFRETAERTMPDVKGISLVPIAALSGSGIDRLFEAIFAVYETWNRRVPVPKLIRWLEDALERHAPPAVGGRRIRLRFMTQPSTRPPTFVAFCSRPADLPKSYVRYLVNGLREAFDLKATPIRFHLRKGRNPYVD